MSSAILYLAIIAIWLCVLIPRWLKRDSARGAAAAADTAVAGESPDTAAADAEGAVVADDGAPQATEPGVTARPSAAPAPAPVAPAAPAAPLSAEETRRRILTGRRRLLGMLVVLEIAAIALAVVGLAAMWVIIPPTIMLTGYLLLLREAAHADAERARHEAEAAAHTRERERAGAKAARARARAAQRVTPAEGTPIDATTAAAALAAKFAAAPVPADYEDSGRDFAPGLAGKYTTSNADPEPAAEEYVYEVPRLRAVGD
jgi:hypothetical protein